MAKHLVQAHGAHTENLISCAPTLEQLQFAHADTHMALASINELPPDCHTHSLPLNAGWCDERKQSFRPFPLSPTSRDDPFSFPCTHHTGLPHTYLVPGTKADLADWEALRPLDDLRPQAIKLSATAAATAWTARAGFPNPVPTRSSGRPERGGARSPQGLVRRAAVRRPR